MKKYTSEQRGRSMIEMLGVLAIVGVLSVAGIAGYSKAMAKYKTNKLIDQVSTVAANVRTTFAGQGNYKGLDSETAYSLGIYPEEVSKECDLDGSYSYGCVKNAFGGYMAIAQTNDDIKDSFDLVIDGVTKDACSTLVLADWGSASAYEGAIKAVSGAIGDAQDYIGTEIFTQQELKDNPMSAVSYICDCNTNHSDCVVGWRFR